MPHKNSTRCLVLAACLSLGACATQRYDARPLDAAASARALAAHALAAPELRSFIEARRPGHAWPPPQWNLELLTLAAFHFNGELDAARARLAAAEAAVVTAGQRPNPSLQLPLQRALDAKDGESPWTLGLALDIPLETMGKRGHRVAEASHRAAAARLELAGAAWSVRSRLREQLLALWTNSEKARLLEQQVALDTSLAAMFDKRLREGYASARERQQQNLVLIQSSRELLAALRAVQAARIELARLLGLPPEGLDGVQLDMAGFVQADPPLPVSRLRSLALLNRADVLAALESYEASQAALQLEVARQYPDLHLGPGYTFDQGVRKPGFDFTGIELPLFNRNEGPIAEARARRQEAAAAVGLAQGKAWAELDDGLASYRSARDALREADRVFRSQQAQLAQTERAFGLGEEDSVALAGQRKTSLAAQLALFEAEAQVQQALGRIEDAIQQPLSAIEASEMDRPQ
jgi:outer membrane protein TolC